MRSRPFVLTSPAPLLLPQPQRDPVTPALITVAAEAVEAPGLVLVPQALADNREVGAAALAAIEVKAIRPTLQK
jgi:hypothetical protein